MFVSGLILSQWTGLKHWLYLLGEQQVLLLVKDGSVYDDIPHLLIIIKTQQVFDNEWNIHSAFLQLCMCDFCYYVILAALLLEIFLATRCL